MPISVRCACGQQFAVKEELAGRTLACPKCNGPLAIPAAPVEAVDLGMAPLASADSSLDALLQPDSLQMTSHARVLTTETAAAPSAPAALPKEIKQSALGVASF